jgi:HSP20 family protein
MPRDTTQQNQRGTRSSASTANARKGATSTTTQSDRQTPIQSGQETGARSRSATPSPAPSRAQGDKLGVSSQQSGSSLSAPVRGGLNDPFALMRRMQDDMDQLFSTFGFGRLGLSPVFGSILSNDLADLPSRGGGGATNQGLWSPQIETFRRGNQIVVHADLPGVNKDDVNVSVDNGVLTISGDRSSENKDEGDGWYRTERSYGSFYRALPLPEGVDAGQCNATFKDGVLEVTLPAPSEENTSTKRIPIK